MARREWAHPLVDSGGMVFGRGERGSPEPSSLLDGHRGGGDPLFARRVRRAVDQVTNKVLHTQGGQRIALRVQAELLRPTLGGNYVLLSCLTDLIARFINTARKDELSHTHSIVRQALDLLNKQFAAPLSLDEVARSVGTNRSTLGRLFRHHVGVSVGEYVRDRRLEWAYRQLTDTNTKIAVIATAAGFADQAHFCRCFKTRYGVTPSSLRNVPVLLAPGA